MSTDIVDVTEDFSWGALQSEKHALHRYAQIHAESKAIRKHTRSLNAERRQLDALIKEYMRSVGQEELTLPDQNIKIKATEKTAIRAAKTDKIIENIAEKMGISAEDIANVVESIKTEIKSVKLSVVKTNSGGRRRGGNRTIPHQRLPSSSIVKSEMDM